MHWLVEMQLGAQARDRRGIGALTHHLGDGIAGDDVQQEKSDDENTEQRGDRREQPPTDEPQHEPWSSAGR